MSSTSRNRCHGVAGLAPETYQMARSKLPFCTAVVTWGACGNCAVTLIPMALRFSTTMFSAACQSDQPLGVCIVSAPTAAAPPACASSCLALSGSCVHPFVATLLASKYCCSEPFGMITLDDAGSEYCDIAVEAMRA